VKELEEYAKRANDYLDAAAKAATDEERQCLFEMAEEWEMLARQVSRRLKQKGSGRAGGIQAASFVHAVDSR
jgi:hypothetical protein